MIQRGEELPLFRFLTQGMDLLVAWRYVWSGFINQFEDS